MENKDNENKKYKIVNSLDEYRYYLLAILIFFDSFCKKNNVEYSLSDGTLLGAIREKNFIPWDDDIDIIITRNNWEKFKNAFKRYNGRYALDYLPNFRVKRGMKKDFLCLHPRLVDKKCSSQRFNIDIQFIDFLGDKENDAKYVVEESKRYQKRARIGPTFHLLPVKKSNTNVQNIRNVIINLFFPINLIIHVLYNKHFLKKYFEFEKKYLLFDENSKFYTVEPYLGRFSYSSDSLIKDGYIKVEFAKLQFSSISNYHRYLLETYGDYMTPPPNSSRKAYHTSLEKDPIRFEIDEELEKYLSLIPKDAFEKFN